MTPKYEPRPVRSEDEDFARRLEDGTRMIESSEDESEDESDDDDTD